MVGVVAACSSASRLKRPSALVGGGAIKPAVPLNRPTVWLPAGANSAAEASPIGVAAVIHKSKVNIGMRIEDRFVSGLYGLERRFMEKAKPDSGRIFAVPNN